MITLLARAFVVAAMVAVIAVVVHNLFVSHITIFDEDFDYQTMVAMSYEDALAYKDRHTIHLRGLAATDELIARHSFRGYAAWQRPLSLTFFVVSLASSLSISLWHRIQAGRHGRIKEARRRGAPGRNAESLDC